MLVSTNFKNNLEHEIKYHKNDILAISHCCKKLVINQIPYKQKIFFFFGSRIWKPDQRDSTVETSSELQAALCLLCQSHS